jgi:hypothetical protein
MEAQYGALVFRFSIIVDSSAESHNGGIVLREFDQITIEHSLFLRCAHQSTEPDAGAAVLMYDNPYDSALANCAFVENRYNESHTLAVASGHSLIISECCFSGPEKAEVNPKNVAVEKSLFEQAECPSVLQTAKRPIGYDRMLSEIPSIRLPKPTISRTTPIEIPRPSAELFARALAASVVIAAMLTALQTLFRRMRKTHRKLPKAIL